MGFDGSAVEPRGDFEAGKVNEGRKDIDQADRLGAD